MYNRQFIRESTTFVLYSIIVIACFIIFFTTIPYNDYKLNVLSSYFEIHRYTRIITLYPFLIGVTMTMLAINIPCFICKENKSKMYIALFVAKTIILLLLFLLFIFIFIFFGTASMNYWDYVGVGDWNIYKYSCLLIMSTFIIGFSLSIFIHNLFVLLNNKYMEYVCE